MNKLARRIIPCLDVTKGRVVKGTNFVDLKDAGDPVELAEEYDRQGADELVFLDITASSDNRGILIDLVEKTASRVFIPFTVGGGINNIEIIRDLLNAGADKVSINTAAIHHPELVEKAAKRFGSQAIVVAIDAKKSGKSWEVFTHGGRRPTGLDAIEWAKKMESLGAGEILLTSMDADGTKAGYDLALTEAISSQLSIPVIASGGAGTCDHICSALNVCEAALLASLLHYKELTIHEIKTACEKKGLPIRKRSILE